MATQTQNLKLIKPELTDSPPDITQMNSNWDKLDEAVMNAGKVKSVNGKTGAVVLSAADVGAETPAGAQSKANAALEAAKAYAETPSGAQTKADKALAEAKKYAEDLSAAGGVGSDIVLSAENCAAMGLPSGSTLDDAITKLAKGILYSDMTAPFYTERRMKIGNAPLHSIVYLKEENRMIPFYVVKHDYESGINGPGRTALLRKDILEKRWWHNDTTNGYMSSSLDMFLTSDYLPRFSATLQEAISRTKFYITRGRGSSELLTHERSIFIPSLAEYGRSSASANEEGSDFTQGQPYAIAMLDGVQVKHWTRTCVNTVNSGAFNFTETGSVEIGTTTDHLGIRPMFTLSKNYEAVWYEDAAGNAYESQINSRVVKLTDMLGKLITIPNSQVQSIAVGKAEVLE